MAIVLINKQMQNAGSTSVDSAFGKKWAIKLRLLSALTGLLLLAGCYTAPKNQSSKLEIETPNNWGSTETRGSFEPQDWVKDFDDPMLVAIIEEALAHNYNLKAAEARLASQIAGSRFGASVVWPSLNGSASQNRNKRSSATGINQTPTAETFGLNLRFNWEIDIWGKVRNGYRADLADIQSAQADYAATRLSIAGRVAQFWYDAIEANQQYDLAVRTQEALESSAVIVEENFTRGIARALDVRLVRANVASNKSTVEARLRTKENSVRVLETLLGRYPANELAVAGKIPDVSGPVPAGLPSELLLRRPDVIAVERTLAANEQRKFETSKARIPSINLTLSRGTTTRELEDVFDIIDRRVWSQALNFSQVWFQGGRLRANFRRAKANYEQSLANYANTVLTAFREVEGALSNQSSFDRDYESQKIAAEESAAAETLAWEEYGRGLTDITTALDAVRRNITAQRSYIQVANQRVQARIDLYLALGGGFDLEPEAEN